MFHMLNTRAMSRRRDPWLARRLGDLTGAWRKPILLPLVTWTYFVWWFAPIILAIRLAFSAGATGDFNALQGWTLDSFRFAVQDPEVRRVFLQSCMLAFGTVVVATPLGASLAIAIVHLRRRSSLALTGLVVLAICTPQAALGGAMFLLFGYVLHFVRLSTPAELLAHISLALPFVVVIVLVRLQSIDRYLEEMAFDLGASPFECLRRVLLPLLTPALAMGGVVAFVLSFDNIVLSNWLCFGNTCRTIPLLLGAGGRNPPEPYPEAYAVGTMAFALSALIALAVLAAFRLTHARKLL